MPRVVRSVLVLVAAGLLLAYRASAAALPGHDAPAQARTGSALTADSLGVVDPAGSDSLGAPERAGVEPPPGPARSGLRGLRGRRPATWSVTLRSGLVPGWGQLVNRKPLKAAILLGVDAWWIGNAIHHESERSRLKKLGDVDGVSRAVDQRNAKLWMMGATALYAMLDAYVDSFFSDYDEGWTGRIGLDPEGTAVAALSYKF